MKIEQREWLWSLLFTTILAVIFLAAAINIGTFIWGLLDDGEPAYGAANPSPRPPATLTPLVASLAPSMTEPYALSVTPQPPEHVLPTVEANVAASELSAPLQPVQPLNTWVLSAAERAIMYARAAIPVEFMPILEAIGYCESKHSPGAVGDGGQSLGWFQLWVGWAREGEDLMDPVTNLQVALRVRETRGRWGGGGGWSCAPEGS